MKRALLIAAHLSDAVLCAGGTFARLSRDGIQTRWLIVGCENCAPDILAGIRRALGIAEILQSDLANIATVVASFDPDVVFSHWHGDPDADHRIVCEAVDGYFLAGRGGKAVSRIAMDIDPAMTGLADAAVSLFVPNMFSDIAATIEQKIMALRQLPRATSHLWTEAAVRESAAAWGRQCGLAAVEPLRIVNKVN